MADSDRSIPGLDIGAFTRYVSQHCPGLVSGPLTARLIEGGRSNLTYEITDGTSEFIVRRPPLGHVLATAHDMGREGRVMEHLADTEVPVPRVLAFCADSSWIGAPFLVLQKITGTVYRRARDLATIGAERTRGICERMVDTLAQLHTVDPAAIGLEGFGRPEGYLNRQVTRWSRQLASSYSRDLDGADELQRLLTARIPAGDRSAIVHGDYRLDNLMIDGSDGVAAVFDWEMATLGDPLADLGLTLVYQHPIAGLTSDISDVSSAAGFLTTDEVVERYAKVSEIDRPDMTFYLGLGFFKRAVILETIHYRYVQRQAIGADLDIIGTAVQPLIDAGIAVLTEPR